jgi:hypothetical protein
VIQGVAEALDGDGAASADGPCRFGRRPALGEEHLGVSATARCNLAPVGGLDVEQVDGPGRRRRRRFTLATSQVGSLLGVPAPLVLRAHDAVPDAERNTPRRTRAMRPRRASSAMVNLTVLSV